MQELKKLLPDFDFAYWIQRGAMELMNRQRENIDHIGYVLFTLPADMSALPEPRGLLRRRILGDPKMSLVELENAFWMIAEDSRVDGVILHLRGAQMGLADLQTLRDSILRLREKGKRVICFSQTYDTAMYMVASAADQILLQPGGDLMTTGLSRTAVFVKDALAGIGVEVEAVAISPYKSAADQFTRMDFSTESRAQAEWLLDSMYEQILESIADGRNISMTDTQAFIDNAPYTDIEAMEAGYVDSLVTEEQIAAHLQIKPDDIVSWDKASKQVYYPIRPHSPKHVALLSITGTIVPGESQNPPANIPIPLLGGPRAGDLTVVQQVRQLMEDKRLGAVVLFVDSPGGSATASEAMSSALDELAKRVPLVVYMNNVAGSGGYYVATPARWIVAHPGTITGSIGVINAKATTQGMFEKLRTNRIPLYRGANADFGSSLQPLTEAEAETMRKGISRIYDQFTERVARSRSMSQDAVDAIGGGRVWTGAQALENGLIDQLGDLRAALDKARELAKLPDYAPLVLFHHGKKDKLPPRLADSLNPAAVTLRYLYEGVQMIYNGRAQMLMPLHIE